MLHLGHPFSVGDDIAHHALGPLQLRSAVKDGP